MFVGFSCPDDEATPRAMSRSSSSDNSGGMSPSAQSRPFLSAVVERLSSHDTATLDVRLAFRTVMERTKDLSEGRCCPWMECCIDTAFVVL